MLVCVSAYALEHVLVIVPVCVGVIMIVSDNVSACFSDCVLVCVFEVVS